MQDPELLALLFLDLLRHLPAFFFHKRTLQMLSLLQKLFQLHKWQYLRGLLRWLLPQFLRLPNLSAFLPQVHESSVSILPRRIYSGLEWLSRLWLSYAKMSLLRCCIGLQPMRDYLLLQQQR